MVFLTKANMLHEKFKISLSISGVVLSVFLILIITGVFNGTIYVAEQPVLQAGADLWVTEQGSYASLTNPSLIPTNLEVNLSNINGVKEVEPLIRIPITVDIGNNEILLNINGYNTQGTMGAPWKIAAGASTPKNGEIIIDRVFAIEYNLHIGDFLKVKDKQFKIVGLSDETSILIAYMAFVNYQDASTFLPANFTNAFLIKLDNISNLTNIKNEIQNTFPNISVHTSQTIAAHYKDEILQGFLPILYILSAISLFVGLLVIAILVYMLTIERSREYGILKALGAKNRYLYSIVLEQSLFIALTGYLIGILFINPVIEFIQMFVPEFISRQTIDVMIDLFILDIAIGFIASLIPVRRLTTIDPAIVFKD